MKARKGNWGDIFSFEDDEDGFETPLDLEGATGPGVEFLEEAHEALSKLSQKTNKRGKLMHPPRRAESWH